MNLGDDPPKAGAPEWMVTFADLMSLLLTFFVLLLSFANMEVVKFKSAVGSIKNALGLKSELELADVPKGENLMPEMDAKEGEGGSTPEQIEQQLSQVLSDAGLESNNGEARVSKHGIVLQLSGDLMFDSGRAEISDRALPVLDGLAGYLIKANRSVDVVGHTDNIPIETPLYPSNWELSAARAGQAVRYLVEKGVPPNLLRAIGQAETVPIADNADVDGRAANRRVEFVFTMREDADTASLEELTGSDPTNSQGASNE